MQDLTVYQQAHKLRGMPNLLEYLSYVFASGNLLAGGNSASPRVLLEPDMKPSLHKKVCIMGQLSINPSRSNSTEGGCPLQRSEFFPQIRACPRLDIIASAMTACHLERCVRC